MMVHGGVGFEGEVSLKRAVLGGVLGGIILEGPRGVPLVREVILEVLL